MTTPIIWNYLENKSNEPVCSLTEARKMKEGIGDIPGLILREMRIASNYSRIPLFFEANVLSPSLEPECIVIPENVINDIISFIEADCLPHEDDCILYLTAKFNQGVSEIRNRINATHTTFGNDVANYGKKLAELEEAIKLYCDCHIDNGPLAGEANISSITISFNIHNEKKSFKIKNKLILCDIMDAIRMGKSIDPSISKNWWIQETEFKETFSLSLFKFLDQPEVSGGNKSEIYIYRLISKVFTISGLPISEEGIKQMFHRAEK